MRKFLSTIDITREEWLKARKKGITGTDVAAIAGLSPYKSAVAVWLEKTMPNVEAEEDNERLRLGRDLEEYVARRFEEATNLKLKKTDAIYQSDINDFQLADFDRFVEGENAIVELKTVSPFCIKNWNNGNVPLNYQMQCQHYLSVSGFDCCYIAALIFGQDFIIRKINREDKVIDLINNLEKKFWFENVINGTIPIPDGSDDCDKTINELFNTNINNEQEIDLNDYANLLNERQELDDQIKTLTNKKNQIDQKIKLRLKNNSLGFAENFKVSWKESKQNKFDVNSFKEQHPDLYSQFVKTTSIRRFLIKKQEVVTNE